MSLTEYLLDLRQAIDESIAKVEALLDGPTTTAQDARWLHNERNSLRAARGNVDTHLQQLERGKE